MTRKISPEDELARYDGAGTFRPPLRAPAKLDPLVTRRGIPVAVERDFCQPVDEGFHDLFCVRRLLEKVLATMEGVKNQTWAAYASPVRKQL